MGEDRAVDPLKPAAAPTFTAPAPNNLRGISFMALGMFIFAAVDAQAKLLTETLHPFQIVWTRQLGLLLGALVFLVMRGPGLLRSKRPGLQVARGALAGASAAMFIFGVRYVPLADAVAITFVAPFMVTLAAAFVLRERVGIRRWAAVVLGFVGVLIVIRPGMGVMHPAAVFILIAATAFAGRQIISRILGRVDDTMTTVAYTALVSIALLTIPLPFVWQWPETRQEVALLVSFALMAGVAEFFVIKALEVGMAVAVAPVHYTIMIWGTFYGFVIFGDLPDLWTWVGAAIIIATGLYTLHREHLAARRRAIGQPLA
ncbi:MAG: DMT family transporter [Pseudomonadota bacterium]